MNVPMADLQTQHRALKEELSQAFDETMAACDFGGLGATASAFERETADYCGAKIRAWRQLRHRRTPAGTAGNGGRAGR